MQEIRSQRNAHPSKYQHISSKEGALTILIGFIFVNRCYLVKPCFAKLKLTLYFLWSYRMSEWTLNWTDSCGPEDAETSQERWELESAEPRMRMKTPRRNSTQPSNSSRLSPSKVSKPKIDHDQSSSCFILWRERWNCLDGRRFHLSFAELISTESQYASLIVLKNVIHSIQILPPFYYYALNFFLFPI